MRTPGLAPCVPVENHVGAQGAGLGHPSTVTGHRQGIAAFQGVEGFLQQPAVLDDADIAASEVLTGPVTGFS